MSEEEKALERFTRERMRRHSKGGFNLPDEDDDDEEQLTHLGKACMHCWIRKTIDAAQALGDVEDDYKPDDEDLSDDEEMQKNMAEFQFGGFAKHDNAEIDPAAENNGPRFGIAL